MKGHKSSLIVMLPIAAGVVAIALYFFMKEDQSLLARSVNIYSEDRAEVCPKKLKEAFLGCEKLRNKDKCMEVIKAQFSDCREFFDSSELVFERREESP